MGSLPQQVSQSLAWRAIEAASRVGAAGRFWGTGRTSCSASCTSSCFNSLLNAPIEAAYTADSAEQTCGGPGAGADRRRPRCCCRLHMQVRCWPSQPLLPSFSRSVLQGGFNSSPSSSRSQMGPAAGAGPRCRRPLAPSVTTDAAANESTTHIALLAVADCKSKGNLSRHGLHPRIAPLVADTAAACGAHSPSGPSSMMFSCAVLVLLVGAITVVGQSTPPSVTAGDGAPLSCATLVDTDTPEGQLNRSM